MKGQADFGQPKAPPKPLFFFGLAALGAPILTLAILELIYALSVPVCRGSLSPLLLHAIVVLTIGGLIGIGLYGRRHLTRGAPLDSDSRESIASFTALLLLAITGICLLILIAQWIAVFVVPCAY